MRHALRHLLQYYVFVISEVSMPKELSLIITCLIFITLTRRSRSSSNKHVLRPNNQWHLTRKTTTPARQHVASQIVRHASQCTASICMFPLQKFQYQTEYFFKIPFLDLCGWLCHRTEWLKTKNESNKDYTPSKTKSQVALLLPESRTMIDLQQPFPTIWNPLHLYSIYPLIFP